MKPASEQFPRLERSVDIEVGRPRNGRPGYAWVTGWVVKYSETRESTPMRLAHARALLRETKAETTSNETR